MSRWSKRKRFPAAYRQAFNMPVNKRMTRVGGEVNNSAVVWTTLFLMCFAYEMSALMKSTDARQPLTYYIREFLHRNIVHWILTFAVWIWLGYHFFVAG